MFSFSRIFSQNQFGLEILYSFLSFVQVLVLGSLRCASCSIFLTYGKEVKAPYFLESIISWEPDQAEEVGQLQAGRLSSVSSFAFIFAPNAYRKQGQKVSTEYKIRCSFLLASQLPAHSLWRAVAVWCGQWKAAGVSQASGGSDTQPFSWVYSLSCCWAGQKMLTSWSASCSTEL